MNICGMYQTFCIVFDMTNKHSFFHLKDVYREIYPIIFAFNEESLKLFTDSIVCLTLLLRS